MIVCDRVYPQVPQTGSVAPPRPAVDDCECEAWDRISRNITSGFAHCRRDAACTGTFCSSQGVAGEIDPFNLTFRLFPCRQKVTLRVHLSIPKKTINWTKDYDESARVLVPGLNFFDKDGVRLSLFVQTNITKEPAQEDVILGVSLWSKVSVPKDNSSSAVTNHWQILMDLIEHQHLPLPPCRGGQPVPEPCRVSCRLDSLVSGCDKNEVCRQVPSTASFPLSSPSSSSTPSPSMGVCECRRSFVRGTDGKCIKNGDITTPTPSDTPPSSPPTPTDGPSNHGAAIGGTLGVLLLLALLVGAFWWWRRRRQTRLRIVRLYDDEEVLMRNDGYQPVSNQEDNNQII